MLLSDLIKRLQWLYDKLGDMTIHGSFFDWREGDGEV